ncbi:hypothetical protein EVJ58_g3856 [Rhodofomes roseus]|uniref:BTB domain-containing protein n=1 Tax=Rhodofomes roseus TaxID=34475 RepID=A0A4Y9YJ90_9APHY|nr:hypothetical protein EVJ58_g3856 [Rhodofomes roseus]
MSNSDAPTVEGTKTPTYNRLFNAPDADLTVRSSDGQLFRVHRRNLYEHTEGFPGEDITVNTDEEIVSLTESASTLELLFQFMYRQEQPDVRQLQSTELFDLAEAVEKYRVFPALQVCNMAIAEGGVEEEEEEEEGGPFSHRPIARARLDFLTVTALTSYNIASHI